MTHVLGSARAAAPGPTVVLMGALHGNEPAGAEVAEATLANLALSCGELVALAGNVVALREGQRMVERDLNRQFTPERIASAAGQDDVESRATTQLVKELAAIRARARGQVVVLDLHTTSAAGHPFSIVGDAPAAHQLAAHFELPMLLGLEEAIVGTFGAWCSSQGCVAMAIEGGQHQASESRAYLTAVVRTALHVLGVAKEPRLDEARDLLIRARAALPRKIRVAYRHAVHPQRSFRMQPGFANIHAVPAGTLLAHDGDEPVHAPQDGLVLLPLYQPQGTDGFFFGHPA